MAGGGAWQWGGGGHGNGVGVGVEGGGGGLLCISGPRGGFPAVSKGKGGGVSGRYNVVN